MEREAFLDRLRAPTASRTPANIAHPVAPVSGVPAIDYAIDLAEPVDVFVEQAKQTGAVVKRTPDEASLRAFAVDVADATGRSVVHSTDPEVATVIEALDAIGCDTRGYDGPATAADADLGVVGAAFAVATTGTVVFDAGRAGGRGASVLPPAVLVVVSAATVLPHAGALFREMATRFPEGPPSQLVLASGPSRTGDIELEITLGVHGPGRVWVALVP